MAQPRAGATTASLTETRDLPGGLGDPFRSVSALPGVVPIASGLPYSYVRGAPPATVGYVYDDIPLPQLFHFALLSGVVHPRMLGPIDFYAGVSPVRLGRRLGGSIEAQGPGQALLGGAEIELRLIDSNAYVEVPLDGGGGFRLAGRFGTPGLILGLIEPDTTLSYWDYQGRAQLPLGAGTELQLVLFGSYDELLNPPFGEDNDRFNEARMEFHRFEARLLQRRGSDEFGLALRLGYDDSDLDRELRVEAITVGPRLWLKQRLSPEASLHMGAEFYGSSGRIETLVARGRNVVAGQRQLRVDVPLYADAPARSTGGAFAELRLRPEPHLELALGLRSDIWIVSGQLSAAVDPRVRATYHVDEQLRLHVGAGLTHQPAVFSYPLPGLTEVALDRGLQESLQGEVGGALQLPLDSELQLQAFVHHYAGLLLPELYGPEDGQTVPTVDALSYGLELLLRREYSRSLSGWVSYTLGFAKAFAEGGARFAPEFDVRHVLNLVLQYRVVGGLELGLGLHVRSGRPFNQFGGRDSEPIYTVRLPAFVRLDARVAYRFVPSWGQLVVYLEWLNATLAKEYLGAECLYGRCEAQTAPAIFFPNLGVRASF